MNCTRFDELIEEYTDGTLAPGDRAAADRHLADCPACHEALRRQRQTGQVLSHALEQATASLRLRPELKQRVLRGLAAQSAVEPDPQCVTWNFIRFLWPWPAIAGAVAVAAWLAWQGVHSPPAAVETARSTEPDSRVSIHLAYSVPTHSFQREGALVRDSLVYHTVVVNGGLGSEPAPKRRNWK